MEQVKGNPYRNLLAAVLINAYEDLNEKAKPTKASRQKRNESIIFFESGSYTFFTDWLEIDNDAAFTLYLDIVSGKKIFSKTGLNY